MSLMYRSPAGGRIGGAVLGLGVVAVSAALHIVLPASLLTQAPAPAPEVSSGATGAILFDLSDIIAAPSEAGEDSAEVAAAIDAPTVTESAEAVDPAKAADEPPLQQIPYEVEDDELKFAVASQKPEVETDKVAHETATEYDEEKVQAETQMGATAQDAAQASVSGVEAESQADSAKAQDEGLTAEQMAQVTQWQRDTVVRISKAKRYPDLARKKRIEGEVLVRFTLDRYGAVLSRAVETSSGWPVLDQAALKVFDNIEKLPTPPSHLSGTKFTLLVPLRYSFR
ncbi:energy transducer TonB [Sagittula salina]|uniref:Energy transducer TonB n=1 Tax=Sagittula salina TaxID=2820268 RepID=A0A940MNG3_9RHOB|nr:TonB family protein [Sagittula salina]MBP0482803.1 energy transducer TonB [Sagittula salina]